MLDIGCGPGRHVLALAAHGTPALGIDFTRTAVELARARGAAVLHRSVFARVPGAGRWRTALLLDGNIGIGADPATLLRRVAELIAPEGEILVELEAPGVRARPGTVRLEIGSRVGPWFRWAPTGVDELEPLAIAAAAAITEVWDHDGRWFASLVPDEGRRGPR